MSCDRRCFEPGWPYGEILCQDCPGQDSHRMAKDKDGSFARELQEALDAKLAAGELPEIDPDEETSSRVAAIDGVIGSIIGGLFGLAFIPTGRALIKEAARLDVEQREKNILALFERELSEARNVEWQSAMFAPNLDQALSDAVNDLLDVEDRMEALKDKVNALLDSFEPEDPDSRHPYESWPELEELERAMGRRK